MRKLGKTFHPAQEPHEVIFGAFGRRVAAVEESVNSDRDVLAGQNSRQRDHMVLMGMHAGRRNESDQMAHALALAQLFDEFDQRRQRSDLAFFDRPVDAWQSLGNDAPGADIHVADFGIAELTARQTHIGRGGLEQAVRAARRQPVPDRFFGLSDGIMIGFDAVTPAVEDAENEGTSLTFIGHRTGLRGLYENSRV